MMAANLVGMLKGGPQDMIAHDPGGTIIGGRYRIETRLGGGGEGDTFRAIDETTGRECALKIFRRAVGDATLRVQYEFQRLIGIDHPGVVRALDIGRDQGRLFLVTELVMGDSIAAIAAILDEPRRQALFARAAREVADALAYLHARGVVHGDVSPANVRIGENGSAVLIDLGASGLASTGGAVGTFGFVAPEALIGRLTPATDLFSLGATLFSAWTGSGPFGAGAESVARMLSAPAPTVSSVRPGLPAGWDRLIDGLLQREPERRWGSARALLREIARLPGASAAVAPELLPPFPAGDPLAGVFVGRAPERATVKQEFERLAEGVSPWAVIAVVGVAGSGRRTLIEVALQDLAICLSGGSVPDVATFRGTVRLLAEWLRLHSVHEIAPSLDDDPLRARERLFARVAAAADARAQERPLVVALADGPEERAFAHFVAGAPGSGRWLVLIAATTPLECIAALDVSLPPLSETDIHQLVARATGDEPSIAAIQRIAIAGAGQVAITIILVRQLVDAIRRGEGDRFTPAPDLALDQVLGHSFAALPPPTRRLVAAVGLGLTLAPETDLEFDRGSARPTPQDEDAARAVGWLVGEPGHLRLPGAAHLTVLRRALGGPDLLGFAGAVLRLRDPAPDSVRAICLEALGQREEAASAFLAAAEQALRQGPAGAVGDAAVWLEEVARLDPGRLDVSQHIWLATSRAWQGQGVRALALLDAAASSDLASPRAAADRLKLCERKAWLLSRAGELTSARHLLEDALASVPADAPTDLVDLARARLARVLVSMGCFAEAVAIALPGASDSVAGSLATESALLAHAYGGELAAARSLHAARAAHTLSPARAFYIAALLDHLAGDLLPALVAYRRALPEAESSGDIHTLAAIALNMGALAAEAGRYDEALAMQDRAIRELGRLGATAELGVALFNAATLLLEIGDLVGTRQIVARLRREVAGGGALSSASVSYLDAELALRDGNEPLALDLFTRAGEAGGLFASVGRSARIARAELLARGQRASEAHALLDTLATVDAEPRAIADLRLARARVLLAGPALNVDVALRMARDLEADADEAAREGRRPRAWRGKLVLARLFHRAGRTDLAAAAVAAAGRLFEEIRMSTPVDHRAGLEQDADVRFLADLARLSSSDGDSDARSGTPRASRSEDRLRRLLRINKRLNSELRLPRLLELIMDTVVELTEAERGFVLLEDDKGELTVKVARNIDQQTLETSAFDVSQSIARQAAAGGVPIVTIDAAGDPRFREALSVSDLHLRSVLAVPLQVKGRAVGTLYVDNRLRKGAFDDDDVQLVLDFAEQAGIAIGNARLLAELRRRERQIEVLNRRLQGELSVRKEEMIGLKQELRENREALAIRYDYRNIIGRTPRMLDLFRLLDRLTDTALPVVIQGESGTGKELVARALHFNGPRRDRPFVSENCAAIPETLLESTLFGAVRGAYTGADHDTRGLFEVADGGTLFLDEVGEMSPGMQGKLLRVLQTGELRRVGSERTRKVDVRVIAATNRDLGRMVEEGRFRQDLFFRLSVAPIALPPLRDRREDIPAMVDHILGKLGNATGTTKAPGVPKRVTPAALARLAAYRWPGNVRELENELMRAAALSDEHIDVADLSAPVAGDAETALTTLQDPDNLSLRPRVERLERALVREALSRCGGNQTRAAIALGLSRFGLQKKMLRYRMG